MKGNRKAQLYKQRKDQVMCEASLYAIGHFVASLFDFVGESIFLISNRFRFISLVIICSKDCIQS